MRDIEKSIKTIPTIDDLYAELEREKYKQKFRRVLKNTVCVLIVVAAVASLIATLVLPIVQITGDSMEPRLSADDIVVLFKTSNLERGDLCAFSYSNKVLIKRVIGLPGDYIDIDKDGNVYVNGEKYDEPYVINKCIGECDIEFPYQVTENQYFMLGDRRDTSIDSRSSVIGCITDEQIIGKLLIRIWPIHDILLVNQ